MSRSLSNLRLRDRGQTRPIQTAHAPAPTLLQRYLSSKTAISTLNPQQALPFSLAPLPLPKDNQSLPHIQHLIHSEQHNSLQIREQLLLCREEIRSLEGVIPAFVGEIEENEVKIKDFQRKWPCEGLLEALKERNKIGNEDRIALINSELREIDRKFGTLCIEKEFLMENLSKISDFDVKTTEKEIEKTVFYSNIVENSSNSAGFDINSAILPTQLSLINSKTQLIERNHQISSMDYKEFLLESGKNSGKLGGNKEEKRKMLRLAAVDRWKREAIRVLMLNSHRNYPVSDEVLLEKLNLQLQNKQIFSLFQNLREKLINRESEFQTNSAQNSLRRLILVNAEIEENRRLDAEFRVEKRKIELKLKGKMRGNRLISSVEIREEELKLGDLLVQRVNYWENQLTATNMSLYTLGFLHDSLTVQYKASLQRLHALEQDLSEVERRESELYIKTERQMSRESEVQTALLATQPANLPTSSQLEASGEPSLFDSLSTSPVLPHSQRYNSDVTGLRTLRKEQRDISPITSREKEELVGLLEWEEEAVTTLPELSTRLRPLLLGSKLYKRFGTSPSLSQVSFDPLLGHTHPPESCGFGTRLFRLNSSLTELHIRTGNKVESIISLDTLQAVLIPRTTMKIVKTQKKSLERRKERVEGLERRYKSMKMSGVVDTESPVYEGLCTNCELYQFYFVLAESGRMDLIARGYDVFKAWILGVNALLRRKGEITELTKRISLKAR